MEFLFGLMIDISQAIIVLIVAGIIVVFLVFLALMIEGRG